MAYYLIFILLGLNMQGEPTLEQKIRQLNQQMEQAFKDGDLKKVASFYRNDGYLLSPGGQIVQGREAIDRYWAKFSNPVKWELEVIAVYENEEDIYENEYWKALKNKPPGWRENGISIDNNKSLVYQLGSSTLTVNNNGKEETSVVDFLLIWQYGEEGYSILLDSYTGQ